MAAVSDWSRSLVDAAAEAIEERLKNETGGCQCDPMWTERGRVDPDCAYHYDVGDQFSADAGRAVVAAVLETLAAAYVRLEATVPGKRDLSGVTWRELVAVDLRSLAAETREET